MKIKHTFLRIFSKHKINIKDKKNIVFYSEGGHYYEVFRLIIENLTKMKIHCSYYTSDKNDKGLEYKSDYCDSLFIGESKLAIMSINYISAKILVMTTPQIDVMYLKKSKDVDYFIHLIHAPTDVFNYKPFAFDFFDCVMCSGQHQVDNIKLIEQTRNLSSKNLLKTGLTYLDGLLQNKENNKENKKKVVLVSPTWGEFGLLNELGFKILKILANANFKVICRPHPQSFIQDKNLMDEIIEKSKQFENIQIDTKPSAKEAMDIADIMISDFSGIIFDFAFVYEKPIIVFIDAIIDNEFLELNEVNKKFNTNKKLWELENMEKIATIMSKKEISNISNNIDAILKSDFKKTINEFKNEALFNYGNAGNVGAKQLANLLETNLK